MTAAAKLQAPRERPILAEGLSEEASPDVPVYGVPGIFSADFVDPRDAYRELWESIHGPDAWAANPFVWCLSFKRVQP